jgi:anti-sigma regulatory factor (Ser/Thr protein kinase)
MFRGLPAEVPHARAFTRGVLEGHPLVDTAELVVSELATNAVRHSLSGEWCGPFIVYVEHEAETVVVSVNDLGAVTLPTVRPLASINVCDASGRGLGLVAELSKDWGFESISSGLRVWAKLVADPSS